MRRLLLLALLGAAALTAASCATMNVSSHVERGLNFAQYHTYDWGPADALPTGDPRLDKDPFFKDHMAGAIEKELSSRRLEWVASSGTPDLLVHYHANITDRLDINRLDRAHGYCAADSCPDAVSQEGGTFVIDVVDGRTNRLIWRGWAQSSVGDILKNRDQMARRIDEAVTRMFARFPIPLS
jgi:hypothetical protein